MKLDIDHVNNVAYLQLRDTVMRGESYRQSTFTNSDDGTGCEVIVDWDVNGAVLGFEFVGARTLLGPLWNEDDAPDPPPPAPISPDYWETAQ